MRDNSLKSEENPSKKNQRDNSVKSKVTMTP